MCEVPMQLAARYRWQSCTADAANHYCFDMQTFK